MLLSRSTASLMNCCCYRCLFCIRIHGGSFHGYAEREGGRKLMLFCTTLTFRSMSCVGSCSAQ